MRGYDYNTLNYKKIETIFFYDSDTTFGDLKEFLNANILVVCVNNYVNGEERVYVDEFEYIHTNSKVLWNHTILETKIIDYLNTFDVNDLIVASPDGIGACNYSTFEWTVNCINSVIDFLNNSKLIFISMIPLLTLKYFIKKYIKKEFIQEENLIMPKSYFFSILQKNSWNLKDFCNIFNIKKYNAITLLKCLGYAYDRSQRKYMITVEKKKSTLTNIDTIIQKFDVK